MPDATDERVTHLAIPYRPGLLYLQRVGQQSESNESLSNVEKVILYLLAEGERLQAALRDMLCWAVRGESRVYTLLIPRDEMDDEFRAAVERVEALLGAPFEEEFAKWLKQ